MEILDLGRVFPSKLIWKKEVKRKVLEAEKREWKLDVLSSTKLHLFRMVVYDIEPHLWWQIAREKPILLGSVTIVVRLMFGEHVLNENSGRFIGLPRQSRLCTVCKSGQLEDIEHFVLVCNSL